MLEALLERIPKKGVKYEHALEEVDRLGVAAWVLLLEARPRRVLELFQVL